MSIIYTMVITVVACFLFGAVYTSEGRILTAKVDVAQKECEVNLASTNTYCATYIITRVLPL